MLIFAMSLWEERREPVSPAPEINCTTPSGNPASLYKRAIASMARGAFSEALKMNYVITNMRMHQKNGSGWIRIGPTVFPAAKAGAIFHAA